MKSKTKRKKIEAVAAIIAVVLALFIVGAVPTMIAGDGGTYDGDVTVYLNATDENSGVANTYYVLDYISPQNGSPPPEAYVEYVGPFVVSEPGSHTVWYYSVDNAGNEETPKSTTFIIFEDIIPPVTTCELQGNLMPQP